MLRNFPLSLSQTKLISKETTKFHATSFPNRVASFSRRVQDEAQKKICTLPATGFPDILKRDFDGIDGKDIYDECNNANNFNKKYFVDLCQI